MRKIQVDGYEIIEENGKFIKAIFKDAEGNTITIDLNSGLEEEFIKRRKEEFREENEKRRHIDNYLTEDYLFEIRTSEESYSIEDIVIDNTTKEEIIKEIWKLPSIQARRVFMHLINEYSLTKIAEIEGVSLPSIKDSINLGIGKLRKNLKKFKNRP